MKCVLIFFEIHFKEGLKLAPSDFLIEIFYMNFFSGESFSQHKSDLFDKKWFTGTYLIRFNLFLYLIIDISMAISCTLTLPAACLSILPKSKVTDIVWVEVRTRCPLKNNDNWWRLQCAHIKSNHWRCSAKKLSLQISQYSQENTCDEASFE